LHLAPGLAAVLRPDLEHAAGRGAADGLQASIGVSENAGLNRGDGFAIIERRRDLPRLSIIRGALEVDAPTVELGAGTGQNLAAGKFDGLVFDRTQNAVR
jgi:hypothetical protein